MLNNRFEVSGATAATTIAVDRAIAGIWNPSTAKRISVLEIHIAKTAAGGADRPKLRRSSARGTATTTVTPGVNHDLTGDLVTPLSGFLLDVTYSVEPTLKAGDMRQFVIPGAIGAGVMWVFAEPIEIPEGEGLVICTGSALAFPIAVVSVTTAE